MWMAAEGMVNKAATPRRVIIMRGFMRRSGTLWFLGTWLGLSALPLVVHAQDNADPLACPDLLAAQRIAAGTRSNLPREQPVDPETPIQIETSGVSEKLKEGILHLEDNVVIRQGERTVKAQDIQFNTTDNSLKAEG